MTVNPAITANLLGVLDALEAADFHQIHNGSERKDGTGGTPGRIRHSTLDALVNALTPANLTWLTTMDHSLSKVADANTEAELVDQLRQHAALTVVWMTIITERTKNDAG